MEGSGCKSDLWKAHVHAGLPVFTGPLYGWSGSQNGLLLAILGIASLPVSFVVGCMAPHISDRSLTMGAIGVTALGAALCTQAGNAAASIAYFSGGGCLYLVCASPCARFTAARHLLSASVQWHACLRLQRPPSGSSVRSRAASWGTPSEGCVWLGLAGLADPGGRCYVPHEQGAAPFPPLHICMTLLCFCSNMRHDGSVMRMPCTLRCVDSGKQVLRQPC